MAHKSANGNCGLVCTFFNIHCWWITNTTIKSTCLPAQSSQSRIMRKNWEKKIGKRITLTRKCFLPGMATGFFRSVFDKNDCRTFCTGTDRPFFSGRPIQKHFTYRYNFWRTNLYRKSSRSLSLFSSIDINHHIANVFCMIACWYFF